jgi:hypothetical protein
MWRGFAFGSLALIVLYVVVQPGVAEKLGLGGDTLVAGAKRLFDPTVAGIGDHSTPVKVTSSLTPIQRPATGGGVIGRYT